MKDRIKLKRYVCALLMIFFMVGVSSWLEEKEVLFPEMAALTIGMWIVDKRVWKVTRFYLVILMFIGAVAGICIVRCSSLPLLINLCIAFVFAACCLIATRTTLVPLISACMLPVLLNVDSWVYPLAVGSMSLMIVIGQWLMEKLHWRAKTVYIPVERNRRKDGIKWLLLASSIFFIAIVPVQTSCLYCILPPLIVTYVEFVISKAGFRNRPVQIFLLLVAAALLGTFFHFLLYVYGGLPIWSAVIPIFICLFALFEHAGKFFAPAGAVALIPMIIAPEDLFWFPPQVAIGAAAFITIAMVLFLKCYKWPKPQLIVCFLPVFIRHSLIRNEKRYYKK